MYPSDESPIRSPPGRYPRWRNICLKGNNREKKEQQQQQHFGYPCLNFGVFSQLIRWIVWWYITRCLQDRWEWHTSAPAWAY